MRSVRILGAVIAVGLALGGAAAATKKAKKKAKPAGCLKAGDAKIQKAQADAAKATTAAFEAALKKQGLTVAALPAHQIQLHEGINEDWGQGNPTGHPYGQKFDGTVDKVKGSYVSGGAYWTGAAHAPAPLEFVEDGKGNLYLLERKPTAGKVNSFQVCECQSYDCGSGCPACGSTIELAYGPIPAGSTFKGSISVSYVADGVTLQYQGVCHVSCPP
jgi:hypothetical protein